MTQQASQILPKYLDVGGLTFERSPYDSMRFDAYDGTGKCIGAISHTHDFVRLEDTRHSYGHVFNFMLPNAAALFTPERLTATLAYAAGRLRPGHASDHAILTFITNTTFEGTL